MRDRLKGSMIAVVTAAIPAVVMLLVTDTSGQATRPARTADGKPKGEFARQVAARRLAIGELDEVAALDTDSRTITLLSRDGKIVTKIPDRGTGYQFRQPVDVKFDRLGHLYVLDRSAVFVFGQFKPFGDESIDRSQPAMLKSVRDLSQYHAAAGEFQVVLDIENDVKWVPSALAGERTLFVAAGSVNAYVDLGSMKDDSNV